MDLKDIHRSKTVQKTVIIIAAVSVALIIFQLGVVAGYHKARFGEHLGENFNKNFMGPQESVFNEFGDQGLPPGGHGAAGKILSVNFPSVIIEGNDNIEKTIVLNSDTEIRQYRDRVGTSSLRVGNFVVILGSPNDEGQVEAKLIRLIPDPKDNTTTTK